MIGERETATMEANGNAELEAVGPDNAIGSREWKSGSRVDSLTGGGDGDELTSKMRYELREATVLAKTSRPDGDVEAQGTNWTANDKDEQQNNNIYQMDSNHCDDNDRRSFMPLAGSAGQPRGRGSDELRHQRLCLSSSSSSCCGRGGNGGDCVELDAAGGHLASSAAAAAAWLQLGPSEAANGGDKFIGSGKLARRSHRQQCEHQLHGNSDEQADGSNRVNSFNDNDDDNNYINDNNMSNEYDDYDDDDDDELDPLKLIVESAQSKLMRRQLRQKRHQLELESAAAAAASKRNNRKSKLLLKSPAFARNTLNEEELDRLAEQLNCGDNCHLADGDKQPHEQPIDKMDGISHQKQRRRQQQSTNWVTDCNRKSDSEAQDSLERDQQQQPLASMTNRQPGRLIIVGGGGRRRSSNELLADDKQAEQMTTSEKHEVSGDRSLAASGSPRATQIDSRPAGDQKHDHHDQDDDRDHEFADRDGPTPTNDLIRALIHRDRLALGCCGGRGASVGRDPDCGTGKWAAGAAAGAATSPTFSGASSAATATMTTTTTTSVVTHNDTSQESGSLLAPKPQTQSQPQRSAGLRLHDDDKFDGNKDNNSEQRELGVEVVPAARRQCKSKPTNEQQRETTMERQKLRSASSLAPEVEGPSERVASTCDNQDQSEASNGRQPTEPSVRVTATSGSDKRQQQQQQQQETRRRRSAFDMSALISKCQRLKLSSPSSSSAGGTNNCCSGRASESTPSPKDAANKCDNEQVGLAAGSRHLEPAASSLRPDGRRTSLSPYQLAAQAFRSVVGLADASVGSAAASQQQRKRTSEPAVSVTGGRADLGAQLLGSGGVSPLDAQQLGQQRRHSTYMFPLMVSRQRHRRRSNGDYMSTASSSSTTSDDDDDDCEIGNHLNVDLMQSDESIHLEHPVRDARVSLTVSDADDEVELDSRSQRKRQSKQQQQQQHSRMLPTSASSPSALSTPTNESGGCGGPCCSEQAQLIKLATENASLSRRLFATGCSSGNQATTGSEFVSPPSGIVSAATTSSSAAFASAASSSATNQQQYPPQRARGGSNPLDRMLRGFHPQHQQPPLGGRQANEPLVGRKSSSAKRHSIINLISQHASGSNSSVHSAASTTGSQLVSRLAQARSSLLPHLNGANHHHHKLSFGHHHQQQQQKHKLPHHRASIGSSSIGSHLSSRSSVASGSGEQLAGQYDPLIPETGFKIVVMGTSGSGKTAIIQRFLYDSFSERHSATVEDTYFVEFPYKKNLISISITDTSGTYQFPAMRRLAINSGDAFVLVYSVDDPQSFDDLEQLRQSILDEREQAHHEMTNIANLNGQAAGSGNINSNSYSSSSSVCSSSANSSTDTSRRSSVSAAEDALRIRRTRWPPIVIVANKCDLPEERHLVNSDEIEALAIIDWNNGFVRASAAYDWNINEIFRQVFTQARQPPAFTQALLSKQRRKSLPRFVRG